MVSKRTTARKGFSATPNVSWPFRLVDNVLSPAQFFFLFSSDDMSLSCRGFQELARIEISIIPCCTRSRHLLVFKFKFVAPTIFYHIFPVLRQRPSTLYMYTLIVPGEGWFVVPKYSTPLTRWVKTSEILSCTSEMTIIDKS